jgi:hypothetical protein
MFLWCRRSQRERPLTSGFTVSRVGAEAGQLRVEDGSQRKRLLGFRITDDVVEVHGGCSGSAPRSMTA